MSKYWLLARIYVNSISQFICTKIDDITGILVLLDAVTFVYPLHVAEMSSHRNSFEYIKSSGASNAGGGKITQLFPVGFL